MLASCRSCGGPDLPVVLSLGETPLANRLRTAEELDRPEPRYPLAVALCRSCSLSQLTVTVAPEVLFQDYPYFSSFSDSMLEHARMLATAVIDRHRLRRDRLVVEIGSNDGYLLQHFARVGLRVLGIDPAATVGTAAEARGIPTIAEFFGPELAARLVASGLRADLIVANNVLAHTPDINGTVAGIASLLGPGGVLVLETPYVKDLLDRGEFDTIYHEHVFYYSLTALESLLGRHGLTAMEVERIPVHGGSLRVTAARTERGGRSAAVDRLLEEEAAWGVRDAAPYEALARRVDTVCAQLRSLLAGLKASGRRLAGYGAAAKGTTLLCTAGIGPGLLDFVVDRSPHKQGRFMPGTRVPICPTEKLLEAMPDDVLLLAWNLTDEVLSQQAEYRRRGGRFVIPMPAPHRV